MVSDHGIAIVTAEQTILKFVLNWHIIKKKNFYGDC